MLEPKYEFITAYGKNLSYKDKHHEYKKLIFKFKDNGKYGLLDANATIVLPAEYDEISSPDFLSSYKKENYRYLVVKKGNNYGVYDYYKKELIRNVEYNYASVNSHDEIYVMDGTNKKFLYPIKNSAKTTGFIIAYPVMFVIGFPIILVLALSSR